MKSTPKLFNLAAAMLIAVAAATAAQEQPKQGDAGQKPVGTAGAWKQALPDVEETSPLGEAAKRAAGGAEEDTPEATKARLRDFEQRWMAALKAGDANALRKFLAADFTHTGGRAPEPTVGRKQYLADAPRVKIESSSIDDVQVRVYLDTAVVSVRYKQQAAVAGEDWSGEFVLTDVWIRQAGNWKAVSRHMSRLTAAAKGH